MYKARFVSKAEKQLKKLTKKNKPLAKKFRKCVREICENPRRESKVGDLKGVWGHGFKYNQTEYRLAYIIYEEELYVLIIGAGSRENFWKEIKRYWNNNLK